MNYLEKFQKMQNLTATSINLTLTDDPCWYIDLYDTNFYGKLISSSVTGWGNSPVKAINDAFRKLTNIPPGKRLMVDDVEYVWDKEREEFVSFF